MLFTRLIQKRVERNLFKGKAVVIYGARRVGKTTLVRQIQEKYSHESFYLNCDEPDVRQALTNKTSTELINYLGGKKLVIIDEAQRVRDIGLTLKLLVDNAPNMQIMATGSSSFDLSNKINEPLTGRAYEFQLTPLSLAEISSDDTEQRRLLERHLVFGLYPEIVGHPGEAQENLRLIYKNYLYKDALEYQGLRNPELVEKLLAALALQIGGEVSYAELANLLGADRKTIMAYIRLLELAFVVFKLPPLSRNRRNEINKSRKIYFWDTGIRNAIINNFNPLNLRNDVGALWENFILVERQKRNNILGVTPNVYFWRTWQKQEVDYVEEAGGRLSGFEFKWGKDKARGAGEFLKTYSPSSLTLINRENFLDFVDNTTQVSPKL